MDFGPSGKISKNEGEKEFVIIASRGESISVPYSLVADAQGKFDQALRLLRKDVDPDVILEFFEIYVPK